MDAKTPPTAPLEAVQSMVTSVRNAKAWALAKTDSIEQRITSVGGEVPAALADAIAELRKEAA